MKAIELQKLAVSEYRKVADDDSEEDQAELKSFKKQLKKYIEWMCTGCPCSIVRALDASAAKPEATAEQTSA